MIYLIDFENVHEEGFSALGRLGDKDAVYCFFTRNVAKISMSALAGIRSGQLHFIEAESGKQSLDLVLVSYLGYLIGTRPQELYYDIISNDNGFSKVADFWNKRGNGLRVRIRKTNELKLKAEPAKMPTQNNGNQNRRQTAQPVQTSQKALETAAVVPEPAITEAVATIPESGVLPVETVSAPVEVKSDPPKQPQQKQRGRQRQQRQRLAKQEPQQQRPEDEKNEGKPAETAIPDSTVKSTPEEPVQQKNETRALDPTVLPVLEAAGINSAAAEFIQAQSEKYRSDRNWKQLVYRAVVKKYGQKAGTQIYNSAKKYLLK